MTTKVYFDVEIAGKPAGMLLLNCDPLLNFNSIKELQYCTLKFDTGIMLI